MEEMCESLGLGSVHTAIKLYGFVEHIDVYIKVMRLVAVSRSERRTAIHALNSYQLRDIKSKIRSKGKTGRTVEMKQGMIIKMQELREHYVRGL